MEGLIIEVLMHGHFATDEEDLAYEIKSEASFHGYEFEVTEQGWEEDGVFYPQWVVTCDEDIEFEL